MPTVAMVTVRKSAVLQPTPMKLNLIVRGNTAESQTQGREHLLLEKVEKQFDCCLMDIEIEPDTVRTLFLLKNINTVIFRNSQVLFKFSSAFSVGSPQVPQLHFMLYQQASRELKLEPLHPVSQTLEEPFQAESLSRSLKYFWFCSD